MTDTTQPQQPILLPCPFCGSSAHITERRIGFRAECRDRFFTCPVNGRTRHKLTVAEAAEAWNTRAPKGQQ